MIGSLRGQLQELGAAGDATEALLDVHGVGYRVLLSPRDAVGLGGTGAEVALSVHTHVREGAITLYGFRDVDQRRCFELLLLAHGVGPALALAIISALAPFELRHAISTGDIDALVEVPGVGRKTAQRLVVDLSSHVDATALTLGASGGLGLVVDSRQTTVRDALLGLGYSADEVRRAIENVADDGSVEELLRTCLQWLAPRS